MRLKLWGGLVLIAALAALAVPLAVGAEGMFPDEMDDPALRAIEPRRQGPEVPVASGRTPDGTGWRLTAYRSHMGLCEDLWVSGHGKGGGCGSGARGEPRGHGHRALSYATSLSPNPKGTSFVHGPTAAGVEKVEVTLSDGRVLDLRAEPAPEALGADVRFYAAAFEGASVRKIAAKDAEGDVVDEFRVPAPPRGPPEKFPAAEGRPEDHPRD